MQTIAAHVQADIMLRCCGVDNGPVHGSGAQHRDVSPVSRLSTLRPARPSRPAQETGLILLGFSLILLAS